MTPDEKGSIAEAMIAAAAVKLRVPVLKPINDGTRYDLVFEIGPRFLRIQCKWAPRMGDVVVVRCQSCRRGRNGSIRRPYTTDEIDVIAAYCPGTDRCYFLPLDRFPVRRQIQLRLRPTRNNQAVGVHWAKDFDFAATLPRLVGP